MGLKRLTSLKRVPPMSSPNACVRCGFGDDAEHGVLVPREGEFIHYFGCLNRAVRVPDRPAAEPEVKPKVTKTITGAPKKQGRRPQRVDPKR